MVFCVVQMNKKQLIQLLSANVMFMVRIKAIVFIILVCN